MNKYQNFDYFILRTPTFSLNKLKESSIEILGDIVKNNVFMEAIYLASRDLSEQLKKESIDINENLQLRLSILKYFTRICVRCTPFGLFAGCSLGSISKTDQSELILSERMSTSTQIDMNFLCFLISNIVKNKEIFDFVRLSPNTSLYIIGKNFRYVYYNHLNTTRSYSLMEAERTDDLQKLINYVKTSKTPNEIIDFLINEGASKNEADEFLSDLLQNQILVTEFEPKLTCGDLLMEQIKIFENNGIKSPFVGHLKQIYSQLRTLDSCPAGSRMELLESLTNHLEKFNIKSNAKSLFKLDLYKNTEKCILNENIVRIVKECIVVLNKLTPWGEDPLLLQFKDNFYARYGDEEIPLLLALDAEVGIGFGSVDGIKNDHCNLLKDIRIKNQSTKPLSINVDAIQRILFEKYEEFIKNPTQERIEVFDNDLIDIQDNWLDVPDTFTVALEILKLGDNPILYIGGAGGTSAANVLGRFSTLDREIDLYVKSITQKEKEINPDSILAEIVHLTDESAGNVSTRTTLREYEIPYLANSSVKSERIIRPSDLLISVRKGKEIVLRSKKLGRVVKPKLTTALNYKNYPLPLYSFLCTLQKQNIRSGFSFSWGPILAMKPFLPRVTYKNQIISKATWNISSKDARNFPKITDNRFYSYVDNFRRSRNIPQMVVYGNDDRKLLIDFHNLTSVQMLFSENKYRSFKLQEFLFEEFDPVVRTADAQFTNEVFLSFYRNYDQI